MHLFVKALILGGILFDKAGSQQEVPPCPKVSKLLSATSCQERNKTPNNLLLFWSQLSITLLGWSCRLPLPPDLGKLQ